MTRNEKMEMLDDARKMMVRRYASYFEYKRTDDLREAAQFATIISALIADL